MAKRKPKVFVGSSSEARSVAQTFCDALQDVAIMIPWWASKEFEATQSILGALKAASDSYDFGLFILTPDDSIESHGKKGMSARDNVLFELGLFLGNLGATRTFAVIQDAESDAKRVKIPADLGGIIIPRFASGDRDTVTSSVHTAANALRQIIERESLRPARIEVKSWEYHVDSKTFWMTLSKETLERNKAEFQGKTLAVVARKSDRDVNPEDDKCIAIGKQRGIPTIPGEDLHLRADVGNTFGAIQDGEKIFGHLLLIPTGCSIAEKNTISDMLSSGCELLATKGVANC